MLWNFYKFFLFWLFKSGYFFGLRVPKNIFINIPQDLSYRPPDGSYFLSFLEICNIFAKNFFLNYYSTLISKVFSISAEFAAIFRKNTFLNIFSILSPETSDLKLFKKKWLNLNKKQLFWHFFCKIDFWSIFVKLKIFSDQDTWNFFIHHFPWAL